MDGKYHWYQDLNDQDVVMDEQSKKLDTQNEDAGE